VDQLATYYEERATEYDAVYTKPERQDDLARLRELLPRLVQDARVLEIAAGTGYWTRVLATSAAAVTATDLNPGPLEIARRRPLGPAPVTFHQADAYDPDAVPGEFDAAFLGFFWSHVPRARLPHLLGALHARLGPGRRVIALDNRYVPGSSTPVSRADEGGDTYQRRTLSDGRAFDVLKNFPTRDEFAADVSATATAAGVTWTELPYYWLASYELR
jgi:protein-L-isoaspartate O-methyltransferase